MGVAKLNCVCPEVTALGVFKSAGGGVLKPSLSDGLKKVEELAATDTRESLANSIGAATDDKKK